MLQLTIKEPKIRLKIQQKQKKDSILSAKKSKTKQK